MIQNLWDGPRIFLRGKFIAIQSYLKKTRKITNKQPNLTHKAIIKRRTKKKPKLVSERKKS